MFVVSVASIRRAAQKLGENGFITISGLARELDYDKHLLSIRMNRFRWLKIELGLLDDGRFPGLVYAHAADCIRLRGVRVTRTTLAHQLGKKVRAVDMHLLRRPNDAQMIAVEKDVPAKRGPKPKPAIVHKEKSPKCDRRRQGKGRSMLLSHTRQSPALGG